MDPQTLRPASDTAPAASALLDQCADMLGSIDQEAYTKACPGMHGSCIGGHLRHTLDHFAAALTALEGETVDYDHRCRQTPVETDLDAAKGEVNRLRDAISAIDPGSCSEPVTIRVMLTGDGAMTELKTTFARELAFATHHAIHHNAMIKAIALDQGVELPGHFGKAPSTIEHESD